MKSLLSQPYWSCLKSLVALLPSMRSALQLSIAAQIQQAQADYILSLKANHPTLFQQVDTWFRTARTEGTLPKPSEHTTAAGHHRRDRRSCWAISLTQLPSLYQSESNGTLDKPDSSQEQETCDGLAMDLRWTCEE